MFPARHVRRAGAFRRVPLLVAASFCFLILATGSASSAPANGPHRDHGRGHWFKHSCAAAPTGFASCDAQVVTNAAGTPLAASAPPASALGPAQFAGAYSLPTSAPSSATIAIVDAYDNPNIESDLAAFDSYYGLPACTTANGCFRKVNQVGGTSYPSTNTGWGLEIALDVEAAHEICQSCKILLVEAISPSYSNLGAAENEAVMLGASVVSNSWGGAESSTESLLDTYFNHPGVVITASAGDSGYGAGYPAASPYVVAVGGTSLSVNADNSYRSETAWSGTGSGCSAYEPKPSSQTGYGCAMRTIADVSADADPNSGAAVYDTYGYSGWVQVGGTSLASPLIAAVYALSGNTSNGAAPYANPTALHDVTNGSNGSCSPSYLCTAGVGYDGPTGLGSPNGLAAFGGAAPPPPAP
jgi:subtilase family serine protease